MVKEVLLKPKVSLVKRLMDSLSDLEQCEEVDIGDAYKLTKKKVRIPVKEYPLQLFMAPEGRPLHLFPEQPLAAPKSTTGDFILFDPTRFFNGVAGFVRLAAGEEVILGQDDGRQQALLEGEAIPEEYRLRIRNKDGGLVFKSLSTKPAACIYPLVKKKEINEVLLHRRRSLRRLRKLFGGKIRPQSKEEALATIREVNQLMEQEPCRPLDGKGRPGGLVELPDEMAPIVIGDLHAKTDNLLSVLSHGGVLAALEQRQACLLLLGDAVHCEEPGRYDQMGGSLLLMDLIFRLKLTFPDQVFYLRGNHDGFSEEIAKGGVPQGQLWEKKLRKSRGDEYRDEMAHYYDQLPYVAASPRMVACHAAPPVSKVERQGLVDARENPKLIRELINNRLYRPHRPGGYNKGDVKRLRKLFGLGEKAPVVVGHTPLTHDETLWENVGHIDGHFVLYSAANDYVGTLMELGGRLQPLLIRVEPISLIINRMQR
jgi:hypothetical protein